MIDTCVVDTFPAPSETDNLLGAKSLCGIAVAPPTITPCKLFSDNVDGVTSPSRIETKHNVFVHYHELP